MRQAAEVVAEAPRAMAGLSGARPADEKVGLDPWVSTPSPRAYDNLLARIEKSATGLNLDAQDWFCTGIRRAAESAGALAQTSQRKIGWRSGEGDGLGVIAALAGHGRPAAARLRAAARQRPPGSSTDGARTTAAGASASSRRPRHPAAARRRSPGSSQTGERPECRSAARLCRTPVRRRTIVLGPVRRRPGERVPPRRANRTAGEAKTALVPMRPAPAPRSGQWRPPAEAAPRRGSNQPPSGGQYPGALIVPRAPARGAGRRRAGRWWPGGETGQRDWAPYQNAGSPRVRVHDIDPGG